MATIGYIEVKRRQEKSYNGIPVAALKSSLQKYARRAMLEKGLWCLIELDLFQLVETEPEGVVEYLQRCASTDSSQQDATAQRAIVQKAKAIRTNLLNRLIVMVSEEINISTYWMPLVIDELAESWKAARRQVTSRKHLIDIYTYLATHKKIRLISDLKSAYLLPPDYVKPDRRRDLRIMHSNMIQSLGLSRLFEGCQTAPENLLELCALDLRPFLDGEDKELKHIINGILFHLKHKSDHVFYWVNQLIDRHRDPQGEVKFGGRKDPLSVVWQLLLGFAEKREGLWSDSPKSYPENFNRVGDIIGVLKKWYETMTHREQPIYLYHAILLIVRRDEIDWHSEAPKKVDTPWHEVEALHGANLSGQTIELDQFVFDMHTGKRTETAQADFADVGALVENEDRTLRNEDYRLIYRSLKERLDVYQRKGLVGVLKTFGGKP